MISVVIPLYNKEPIIEKTLNSVLSQDYSDFEDFTQSFDKAGNVMLYVPYGSGHKYRRDKRFKGFKEIRIERTNTSLARNKLH